MTATVALRRLDAGQLRRNTQAMAADKYLGRLTDRDPAAASPYHPAATYWFCTIARLDPRIGVPMLRSADEAFELAALTAEIFLLAPNVLAKHRWVNKGWAAAGT